MKRVAIIADSHFDETSRFEECVRVHQWIAEDIARRGVDLVLHSGDVYERKSTPRERMEAARFFQACAEIAPVVIVRGNHDALGDLPLLAKIRSRFGIEVVEGVDVVDFQDFSVGCLAWPSKASILALGAESHAEGEFVAGEALRNVLRGLARRMENNRGAPRILLAHAMVRGALTSTGQPLVGCDLEMGVEDLALAGADFVALGHIHKGQNFSPPSFARSGDLATIVYPGSPRRTAFGELESKGYVLAEFDGSTCARWELVKTPCAPMVHIEAEHAGGELMWQLEERDVTGAEVRLRYTVDADRRAEAREVAEQCKGVLLLQGAAHVKLEEVVRPVNAARAPEIAKALTLVEKMWALWRARGTTPESERAERLLGKASELEVAR